MISQVFQGPPPFDLFDDARQGGDARLGALCVVAPWLVIIALWVAL